MREYWRRSGKVNRPDWFQEVTIKVFAQTHVGMIRKGNEDSFLVLDTTSEDLDMLPKILDHTIDKKLLTMMVSDGMGGAAAGEVASELAVKTALDELHNQSISSEEKIAELVIASLEKANDNIANYAIQHPEMRGMGATATTAVVRENQLFVGQVGDSRAYLIRNRQIRQITKDQSFVNQLVEAGKITEDEAEIHPRRNVILQALGNQPNLRVALTKVALSKGDFVLICSDGLSGLVKKEEMLEIITSAADLKSACNELVNLANQRGGNDNVTVVLSHFNDKSLKAPSDSLSMAMEHLVEFAQRNEPAVGDETVEIEVESESEASQPVESEKPKGIRKLFKGLMLFALALTAGGALFFLGGSYFQKQNITSQSETLKKDFQTFREDHQEDLRLLAENGTAFPDTFAFKNLLHKTSILLDDYQISHAQLLADSALTKLDNWKTDVVGESRHLKEALKARMDWKNTLSQIAAAFNELEGHRIDWSSRTIAQLENQPISQIQNHVSKQSNLSFLAIHSRLRSQVDSLHARGLLNDDYYNALSNDLEKAKKAHVLAMRGLNTENTEDFGEALLLSKEALILLKSVDQTLDQTRQKLLNQVLRSTNHLS